MDKNIVLKAENISKQYRLGEVGTGTISHDLNRWWHRIRGLEDPYQKVGSVNDRTKAGGDYVWALKDINFEVEQGEVLGIIGKNGAGKSTLLKVLSKVTGPSTGSIKMKGRVASLLEVGTGFHPELTGRENIYLNGAILGMTRAEVSRKLDEIVEFAGVAKYLDTPAKRYSSGMTVRLGFAVAAHLEPEILIVDEVLAVGDAEFQKQAIGKMQEVSQKDGRTVLFVSHNMASIKNLCKKCMILENGGVSFSGDVNEGVARYLQLNNTQHSANKQTFEKVNAPAQLNSIATINEVTDFAYIDKNISFNLNLTIREMISDMFLVITIEDVSGNLLIVTGSDEYEENILANAAINDDLNLRLTLPQEVLKPGKYYMTFSLRQKHGAPFHKVEKAIAFNIVDTDTHRGMKDRYRRNALVAPSLNFELA